MNDRVLEEARISCERIIDRINEVYVGDRMLLQRLLAAALANGHVLIEDYPGLGKTLLAKAFARAISGERKRIQFTPDLLPSDILGMNIWSQRDATFRLMRGPVFTNVLLADEINRAPPKTQSALLEAMEERHVTLDGQSLRINPPFVVIATQNPIEQEGTYPLPEAQLDRFLLKLSTGYPASAALERDILLRRIQNQKDDPAPDLEPAVGMRRFVELQQFVETGVYTDQLILDYITQLVRLSREHPRVAVGVSPRGGLALLRVVRAMALIQGRDFAVPDDVKSLAPDVLSHRIILNIEDTLEGIRSAGVVDEILSQVPAPTGIGEASPR
jgi:MoxR-like ATPase